MTNDTPTPTKRPRGRPPGDGAEELHRIAIRIRQADLDTAKRLGDGNISQGIRLALEAIRSRDHV